MDFPLRHISIRVPWHDAGWAGLVCQVPQLNGACTKLKRIAAHKKDDRELAIAGRTLDDLPHEQWPCCVDERAAFNRDPSARTVANLSLLLAASITCQSKVGVP